MESTVKNPRPVVPWIVLSLLATLAFFSVTQAQSSEVAPVFTITPVQSKVTFCVKS